jgi:hypothetical protein
MTGIRVAVLGLMLAACAAAETVVPNKIIDSPTAGNLQRGAYQFDFKVFPGGGILSGIAIGITNYLSLGLSYGASNIIGSGPIHGNTHPGIQAQIRFIDENTVLPALALGYDNQGIGPYVNSTNVYYVHAKGAYLVASKNYLLLGNLGFHGGINYRVEERDPRPNLFLMINKDLNKEIALCAEYDAALNNDRINRGLLNAGAWWIFGNKLKLEVDFKNILESTRFVDVERELRIVFFEHF